MTIKEFLLSVDQKLLFEILYDNYRQDILNKLSKDEYHRVFLYTMDEISSIVPLKKDDEVMVPERFLQADTCSEHCGEGRWIGSKWHFISEEYSISLVNLDEIRKMQFLPVLSHVHEKNEIEGSFPYPRYSCLMDPWDYFLGVSMLFIPDEAEYYAASFYEDITFFGHSKITHEDGVKDALRELEKGTRDIDEGNYVEAEEAIAQLRNKFGFEEPDEKEKQMRREFSDMVLIRSYNQFADQYNERIRPELMKAAGIYIS